MYGESFLTSSVRQQDGFQTGDPGGIKCYRLPTQGRPETGVFETESRKMNLPTAQC